MQDKIQSMVDPNKIRLIEISPCGRLLAVCMGKDVLIKLLNQPTIGGFIKQKYLKKLTQFRKLDSFLPIYFDNDYTRLNSRYINTGSTSPASPGYADGVSRVSSITSDSSSTSSSKSTE